MLLRGFKPQRSTVIFVDQVQIQCKQPMRPKGELAILQTPAWEFVRGRRVRCDLDPLTRQRTKNKWFRRFPTQIDPECELVDTPDCCDHPMWLGSA